MNFVPITRRNFSSFVTFDSRIIISLVTWLSKSERAFENQYYLRWCCCSVFENKRDSEHSVRRLESKIYTCKLYCIWFFFLLEYKVGGGRAEQLKAVATQLSRALIAHSRHSKVPAGLASPTAQNLSKYVSGQCATAEQPQAALQHTPRAQKLPREMENSSNFLSTEVVTKICAKFQRFQAAD